jgi:hypothetical protein
MADERAKRITELIKPLKVKPGSEVNPQGVRVISFRVPPPGELDHDYLWRYARRLPARVDIGIFDRSHCEEVPEPGAGRRRQPLAVKRELGEQAPIDAPAGPFAAKKARMAARDPGSEA